MNTATTTIDQTIGNADRTDYFVPETTRAQPVRYEAPSQYARFLEEEIQWRTASIAPDLRILKDRAKTWLRRDEPSLALDEAWLESKACGLVSFTRSFFAAYQGFRNAPASL